MRSFATLISMALLAIGMTQTAMAASRDPLVIPAPDLDGGPIEDDAAMWHILGLPPGRTLNMRSGPGSRFRVIALLPDATPVEHLGCQERLGEFWCRVATLGAPRISGWVNGRYVSDDFVPPRQSRRP
ncbi:SH3 domain-containing protein [Rhizobium halophytocola]|uniref:SH3b domain-containing protein n=1 Tax=Rhizobium halophytocola TaxID=735519 RepID=A0ABS4DTL5_9HYPH|nr:SH3 domain-containing protein [Rhizobium halophytocola]MBP1849031.1 hypothetical protein [Rhizobium halophytocola]